MPLGGYCNTCQRWVWLNPYGECENGHPAAAVRDVQQLKPAVRREAVIETPPLEARARLRWWWRYSLWMGWTFTAGFFNWLGFMYIGARARVTAWIIYGFAYLVPLLLTIASIGTPLLRYAIVFQLFVSAVSVLQALHVRPMFRAIMFGDAPRRTLPAPPQPPSLAESMQRPQLPRTIDDAAAEVIRAARAQVDAILTDADDITKNEVRERIVRLCRTADEILAELAAKPRKLDAARSFLTYYLDAAARIVQGYASLSRHGGSSPEVNAALGKAEASLDSVQQAFDRQLANVLEDRVLDLESEIELLEKTVDMETMFSQTGGQ